MTYSACLAAADTVPQAREALLAVMMQRSSYGRFESMNETGLKRQFM